MTSVELYWRPGTCARVPFVALEEIGVPFEVRVLNAWTGDMDSPEFRAMNPKGRVPVLKLDDWCITENPVILRTLAAKFPEAGLLPSGDERTAVEAQELMAWFATLHPVVARQRFPRFFTTSTDAAHWEAIRLQARDELGKAFRILERRLDGREWLFDEWSIVDVYMLYLWWRAIGSGMDPTPFPRCTGHGRRIEARPTVATVLDREEVEFARFEAAGTVPENFPPHYVGRIPTGLIEQVPSA